MGTFSSLMCHTLYHWAACLTASLRFEQIQLTPQQLQSIQMQLQGKTSAQSIVIQSSQAVQAQPADQMAQLAAASQVIGTVAARTLPDKAR